MAARPMTELSLIELPTEEPSAPTPRIFRRTRKAGRRALSVGIMGVWIMMPLLPVLAIIFSWLDGLS
jgi:hypothetical protein